MKMFLKLKLPHSPPVPQIEKPEHEICQREEGKQEQKLSTLLVCSCLIKNITLISEKLICFIRY